MSGLPGFGASAPGFDEPLEMLAACHGRIEAQLRTLERLVAHLATHGADAAARGAAQAVMRYFDSAGVRHHEDEEEDLFPALRAHVGAHGATALVATLDALQREHSDLSAAYAALRARLVGVGEGAAAYLDAAEVESFARLYRDHIGREARDVLPFAARVLGADERAALGARMAARRGVKPATIPR